MFSFTFRKTHISNISFSCQHTAEEKIHSTCASNVDATNKSRASNGRLSSLMLRPELATTPIRATPCIIVYSMQANLSRQSFLHSISVRFGIIVLVTARRYASAVLAVVACLSVCLSVCHKPVLYRNGYTLDHANNATRQPRDSSFLMPKIFLKFERGHPQRGR